MVIGRASVGVAMFGNSEFPKNTSAPEASINGDNYLLAKFNSCFQYVKAG
jgi:hypothetical protein